MSDLFVGPWAGPPDSDECAEIVKRTRAITGHTQAEFARLLGVARLTVLRWENQQDRPTEPNFARLRGVLRQYIEGRFTELAGKLKAEYERAYAELDHHLAVRGLEPSSELPHPVEQTHESRERDHRWVAAYSDVLSDVLLHGGRALLDASSWGSAVGIGKALFRGVPAGERRNGERLYWGYDVGNAIEAAIRGKSYRTWIPDEDARAIAADRGEARVLGEAQFVWRGHLDHFEFLARLRQVGHDPEALIRTARERRSNRGGTRGEEA